MDNQTQTRLVVANTVALAGVALFTIYLHRRFKKVTKSALAFVNTYEMAMTDIAFRDIIRKNF